MYNEEIIDLIRDGQYLAHYLLYDLSIAELEKLNQETIDKIMRIYRNYKLYNHALNNII